MTKTQTSPSQRKIENFMKGGERIVEVFFLGGEKPNTTY